MPNILVLDLKPTSAATQHRRMEYEGDFQGEDLCRVFDTAMDPRKVITIVICVPLSINFKLLCTVQT